MKPNYFILLSIVLLMASCGTQKQTVTEKIVIPPPAGVEVMDVETKVFSSLKLPNNDNWVDKTKDATWRSDENVVKKMDGNKTVSVIRTMTFHNGNVDLNDTVAILKSINSNAGMLLGYNDYHFKKDGDGNPIETPVYTTKIITISNGTKVILMEAEVKNTIESSRIFGNSYYARNYFILANREDGEKCIPVVFSAVALTPDNYTIDKQKHIELVDYVVKAAELKPEYIFKN